MEDEIDIAALEAGVKQSLEQEEVVKEEEFIEGEFEVDDKPKEEEFDLDAALDSVDPVDLTGKISEEDAEAKAAERGWRKDGLDKYGHRISAIEFLERAPFFRKMELLRNDVDQAKKMLEKVTQQNQQIAKKSIEDKQRMVEEFKAEKERLLNDGYLDQEGIDRLKAIDSKLSEPIEAPEPEVDDIVKDYETATEQFKQENEWYGTNRAMTTLADKLGTEYASSYKEKHGRLPPPEDTLKYVLDEVKKDFPDKPVDRRPRVAPTNGRTVTQGGKPKSKTINDLPEEMRPVAREIMSASGITEEEYLKTYRF